MVYFIRARTHYQYARLLFEEILKGKKELNFTHLKDVFWQALKALYSLTEIKAYEKQPTLEEIVSKVLPTLSDEEREILLYLKNLFSGEADKLTPSELKAIFEKVRDFLSIVERALKPIL